MNLDILKTLQPGERAWFGFSAHSGLRLAALDRRPKPRPGRLRGLVSIDPTGALVFHGSQPAPRFLSALMAWALPRATERPALRRLAGARYSHPGEDGQTVVARSALALWATPGCPVAALRRKMGIYRIRSVLEQAAPGQTFWFWFAGDAAGLYLLPTRRDPEGAGFLRALHHLTAETPPDVPRTYGEAIVAEDGRLFFYSQHDYTGFIADLAGWARAGGPASLRRLAHARFLRFDHTGAIAEIQEDPDRWR